MNAWMSPIVIAPADTQPADDGDGDEVQVAEEHHHRLDDPGHELRPEAGSEQLLVLVGEPRLDLALAPEGFDQRAR